MGEGEKSTLVTILKQRSSSRLLKVSGEKWIILNESYHNVQESNRVPIEEMYEHLKEPYWVYGGLSTIKVIHPKR